MIVSDDELRLIEAAKLAVRNLKPVTLEQVKAARDEMLLRVSRGPVRGFPGVRDWRWYGVRDPRAVYVESWKGQAEKFLGCCEAVLSGEVELERVF